MNQRILVSLSFFATFFLNIACEKSRTLSTSKNTHGDSFLTVDVSEDNFVVNKKGDVKGIKIKVDETIRFFGSVVIGMSESIYNTCAVQGGDKKAPELRLSLKMQTGKITVFKGCVKSIDDILAQPEKDPKTQTAEITLNTTREMFLDEDGQKIQVEVQGQQRVFVIDPIMIVGNAQTHYTTCGADDKEPALKGILFPVKGTFVVAQNLDANCK